MGSRRRHLFVLLFVLGLVVVSAVVIAKKETKLGLDLQGGLELVYEGQPTEEGGEVTGDDIEDSISIIEKRVNELGVSESEVARLGNENVTVALPGITDAERAAEQVGSTAQLYFYDWEPNLIGPERAIGGTPGSDCRRSDQRIRKTVDRSGPQPEERTEPAADLRRRLPERLRGGAARLRTGTDRTVRRMLGRTAALLPVRKGRAAQAARRARVRRRKTSTSARPGKRSRKTGSWSKSRPATSSSPNTRPTKTAASTRPRSPAGARSRTSRRSRATKSPTPNRPTRRRRNEPIVSFEFTGEGRDAFQEVTRKIAQRGQANAIGPVGNEEAAALSGHFAVVLDNEVQSRPIINFKENPDGIDGRTGAQISGGFSNPDGLKQAQELATTLQIGALPINLKLISETQVSATLGSQALDDGIKAGIIGLALVVIFLLVYYRFLGLIASIALGAYGIIFFALIDLIPITLTLPGIAGLVLTIGVAADSNIVIFERIKEEVRAGRAMSSAIAAGYKRGIATIIDANVVTLLTAFILFVLATAGVKGFAFTLGVGTIVSLLTAVVFTQALLGSMSRSRLLRSPSALGASGKGRRWHFDFMGASRWFFSISGVILLIGAMALATKQLNFGIDFESGTRITVALEKPTERGRRAGNPRRGRGQRRGDPAGLRPGARRQRLPDPVERARTRTGERSAQRRSPANTGSPKTGSKAPASGRPSANRWPNNALKALIFSLLVICGYIALRFDPKFAVPVLIAIFHDILITAGVYSLTGKEVTSGTVAAFLTILGYSIYDTIIVFDRIRENVPRMPRAAFSQIVNRSMSEVLTRSLATSFSTLLAVASLLVFGGATLQDFAFAMLVGIVSGTYSSIFIASPVLTAWKEREPGFIRRRLRIAEVEGGVVPAYADDVQAAMLAEDAEAEGDEQPEEVDMEAEVAAETRAEAVATAERGSEGNGGDPEAARTAAEEASAERRERNEERRARAPAAPQAREEPRSRWHCSSSSRWASPSGTSRSSCPTTSGRGSSAPSSAP